MRNPQTLLVIFFSLMTTSVCFAQFGGGGMGGGGMGGGGMGRQQMGGGMDQQQQANFKPSVPNIAGDLANRETKWLKEKLNLTKEQGKTVKNLNNEYGKLQQEAIKEIVNLNGGAGARPTEAQGKAQTEQMRDAMMMYNEQKEEELKKILTREQWATYQTGKDQMQREVGGIRPPAPREFRVKTDTTKAKQ